MVFEVGGGGGAKGGGGAGAGGVHPVVGGRRWNVGLGFVAAGVFLGIFVLFWTHAVGSARLCYCSFNFLFLLFFFVIR